MLAASCNLTFAASFDIAETSLQIGDASVDKSAVGFELLFTRALTAADATLDAFQVSPHPGQSRPHVQQLRQFHLQLRFVRPGMRRKDIEDHLATVHDLCTGLLFNVLALRGAEVIVEHDQVGIATSDQLFQFDKFAATDVCAGVRLVPYLHQVSDNFGAGRFRQAPHFIEGTVAIFFLRGIEHGDKHGPPCADFPVVSVRFTQGVLILQYP